LANDDSQAHPCLQAANSWFRQLPRLPDAGARLHVIEEDSVKHSATVDRRTKRCFLRCARMNDRRSWSSRSSATHRRRRAAHCCAARAQLSLRVFDINGASTLLHFTSSSASERPMLARARVCTSA
jgi:hypothetical protein